MTWWQVCFAAAGAVTALYLILVFAPYLRGRRMRPPDPPPGWRWTWEVPEVEGAWPNGRALVREGVEEDGPDAA